MNYAKYMPTDSRRLAQSVSKVSRRLRQERQSDLSAGQLSVMAAIVQLRQSTPSQLAVAEKVSGPAMTRTLNCLEKTGYIARFPHPTDGRQVLIEVSPAGREALADERQRRDAWLDARLKTLSSDDRATLRNAIKILDQLIEDEA
ncbi:MAG: MarR family transcriptional regulator [Aeromicrobium sp.]|nr:MAG: MarR family transcriptional regulator [Aeromicrobium sp.]